MHHCLHSVVFILYQSMNIPFLIYFYRNPVRDKKPDNRNAPRPARNPAAYPEYHPVQPGLRNCRKISDADCVGYFFEVKLLKQLSKNVGVAGYGEAFGHA